MQVRFSATALMLTMIVACTATSEEESGSGNVDARTDKSMDRLVWVDRDGNLGEAIGAPMAMIVAPSLSPDGARIAFRGRMEGINSIWIYDVGSGERLRLTSQEAAAGQPTWSPLGDRVAFITYRNGLADVYMRRVNGRSEAEPVVVGPLHEYYPDWVPDGSSITFHSLHPDTEQRDIWMAAVGSGREPIGIVTGEGNEALARISPDGRYLAYQSDETGSWEVYIVSFPDAGEVIRVSTNGGVWPKWSIDGEELFYFDENGLMAVSISIGGMIATDAPRRLFTTDQVGMRNSSTSQYNPLYDVAPDGRFVVVRGFGTPGDITGGRMRSGS